MKQKKPLVCRVCQKHIGVVDAATGVCPTCDHTKNIAAEVGRPAWEILRKPYSKHPADNYLEIVLAAWGTCEWVTWLYNKSMGGYNEGHYFTDYQEALEDYYKRGNLPLENFSVCVFLNVRARSPRGAETITRQAINTLDTNVDIVTLAVGRKVEEEHLK